MTSWQKNFSDFREGTIKSELPPFPFRLMIESTNMCNHRCLFCAHANMTRKPHSIDLALLERALREAFSLGTREIGLHGGAEPFLHKKLPQIVALCKAIGFEYIYLSTNGAASSQEMMEAVLVAGIDSIKLSINAGSKEEYKAVHGVDAFEKALDTLRFIHNWRSTHRPSLKLYVSSVRVPENAASLVTFEERIAPFVDSYAIVDAMCQSGQNSYGKQEATYKAPSFECLQPFNSLTITCEGFVRTCCNDYQNYLALSDLNTSSLKDIWESEAYRQFRQQHLSMNFTGLLCYNCIYNPAEKAPVRPIAPDLATIDVSNSVI